MSLWEVQQHDRCTRGLHFVFHCFQSFDPLALAALIETRCGGRAIRRDERWGERLVPRIIVQFESEYRIAERPGEVSLIHRVIAKPAIRAAAEARLVSALEELLGVPETEH